MTPKTLSVPVVLRRRRGLDLLRNLWRAWAWTYRSLRSRGVGRMSAARVAYQLTTTTVTVGDLVPQATERIYRRFVIDPYTGDPALALLAQLVAQIDEGDDTGTPDWRERLRAL